MDAAAGLAVAQAPTAQTRTAAQAPVAAPPGAQPPPAAAPAPPASIPRLEAVASAPLACGGAVPWTEDKAIAQTGRAKRAGAKLTVGGMTFTDVQGRGAREPNLYFYIGVFGDSGLDLVQVQKRESSHYLLVDTAKRSAVELQRFPVPSPSSRYFAIAAPALGVGDGGIEVAERVANGLKLVATLSRADLADDPCRLTNLTWLSDDRFAVRVLKNAAAGGKGPSVPAVYEVKDGKLKQVG